MAGQIGTTGSDGQDFSKQPVPAAHKMGKFSLTMAWWGCCSAMFWLVLSATLAEAYGTINTILGMFAAVLTYTAICRVLNTYAMKTGTSVSLFSRLLFGTRGSALATLIFSVTATYYAVFESSVIAVAATYQFPTLSYPVAVLLVILISAPLVFGDVQTWLNKLNGILLPFYIIGLVVLVYVTIDQYGYSNDWLFAPPAKGDAPQGWWNVYVSYLGVWTLIMVSFDYSRFARYEDRKFHLRMNFGAIFWTTTFLISGVIGIFLVKSLPPGEQISETSSVKAVIMLTGGLGLFWVWVTQTRINSANFYMAVMNLSAFSRLSLKRPLPKVVAAAIIIGIVYALMLADIFHVMLVSLAYQGIFVVAWVAVALSHILFRAPKEPMDAAGGEDEDYPAYNPRGLTAWFAAVAIGIALMKIPFLSSFSAPATAISGFIFYRLMFNQVVAADAKS